MQILRLPIEKKWFDMIRQGEKVEEYREIKYYYVQRLLQEYMTTVRNGKRDVEFEKQNMKSFAWIEFSNGYGSDVPKITVEHKGTSIGLGRPEWGAPNKEVFILHLGKVLTIKNFE